MKSHTNLTKYVTQGSYALRIMGFRKNEMINFTCKSEYVDFVLVPVFVPEIIFAK